MVTRGGGNVMANKSRRKLKEIGNRSRNIDPRPDGRLKAALERRFKLDYLNANFLLLVIPNYDKLTMRRITYALKLCNELCREGPSRFLLPDCFLCLY